MDSYVYLTESNYMISRMFVVHALIKKREFLMRASFTNPSSTPSPLIPIIIFWRAPLQIYSSFNTLTYIIRIKGYVARCCTYCIWIQNIIPSGNLLLSKYLIFSFNFLQKMERKKMKNVFFPLDTYTEKKNVFADKLLYVLLYIYRM